MNRGTAVSDWLAGTVYFNYEYPRVYTIDYNFIGGDLKNYVVGYKCVNCTAYGSNDVGSKEDLF